MNNRIVMLMLILIAMPIALAYDRSPLGVDQADTWGSFSKDYTGNMYVDKAISNGTFTLLQSFSAGATTINVADLTNDKPLAYDFNQDGYTDILAFSNGLAEIFLYDPIGKNFSISSSYLLDGSTRVIGYSLYLLNHRLLLLGADATATHIWEITNTSTISLVSSAASTLSDFSANGGGRSITCQHPFGFTSDMCAVMATNTTFYLTNITDVFNSGFTMSSKTLEGGNIFYTTGSNKQNQMISTDLYTEQTFVTSCENATGKGLIELHPFNGSVITASCGRFPASTYSTINSLLQGNIGNGVYDWMGYTQNSANQDAPAVGLMNPFNYAMRTATFPVSTGGANSIGRGMCFNRYQNKMIDFKRNSVSTIGFDYINSTGGVSSQVPTLLSSINSALYGIVCGRDFVVSDRGYIDLYSGVARNITTASAQWISFYSDNSLFLVSNVNSLDVFKLQAAPPTYANNTYCFRDSVTNTSFEAVLTNTYNITTGSGAIRYSSTIMDGFLPSLPCTPSSTTYSVNGTYNMTTSVAGYLPYNQQFNNSLGSNTIYFYLTRDPLFTGGTFFLTFEADDITTGAFVNNIVYTLTAQNGTHPYDVVQSRYLVQGADYISGLLPDNYNISIVSPGYLPYSASFNINQNSTKKFLLTPTGGVVASSPYIATLDVLEQISVDGAAKIVLNPGIVCQNDTIQLNMSVRSTDMNAYNMIGICDVGSNQTAINAVLNELTPMFVTGTANDFYFNCKVPLGRDSFLIGAFPTSPYLGFNTGNYSQLLANNVAKQINVSITSSCTNTKTISNINGDSGLAGSFMGIFNGFGAQSKSTLLLIGIVFFIIISAGGGVAATTAIARFSPGSDVSKIFMVAAGFCGIAASVLLSVVFPLLPLYISFVFGAFSIGIVALSFSNWMNPGG